MADVEQPTVKGQHRTTLDTMHWDVLRLYGEMLTALKIAASNHGGVADTSELWAVSGAYVRPDKIAMGDPVNRDARGGAMIGPTGVEGDPRRSSPALGKIFDDIKVKDGVDEIRTLLGRRDPARHN